MLGADPTAMDDGQSIWRGKLTCLEFLLQHSLRLRIENFGRDDGQPALAMAEEMARWMDPMLACFRQSNPEMVNKTPRLVALLTLSAVTGCVLFYNAPDCPSGTAGSRCCKEHRVEGWGQALALLKGHFGCHFALARRYKQMIVLLASVVAVCRPAREGRLDTINRFVDSVSGLFGKLDQAELRRTTKMVQSICREIQEDSYDVDLDLFEATMLEFIKKQAAHWKADGPSLVDRFSDLIHSSLECKVEDDPDLDPAAEQPASVPRSPPLDIVPGAAFRDLLASDDLLAGIIHRSNSKVFEFVLARKGEAPRRPRLTDQHDSGVQVEWTLPSPKRDVQELHSRSAIHPSFTPRPRLSAAAGDRHGEHQVNSNPRSRRPWTAREINCLLEGHRKYGSDWRAIQKAYGFTARTNVDLKDKFRHMKKTGQTN